MSLWLAYTAAAGPLAGAIFTTTQDGTAVNQNIYGSTEDVYLSGGPQNTKAAGLSDGTYYFQVTDPGGSTLLSTDNAACRQLLVTGGRVAGATGPCPHSNGTFNAANGTLPVKVAPFSATPNAGNEFKAWLIPTSKATISASDPKVLIFSRADAKTDNFKAQTQVVPQGSCQPSSSLSVLVSGTNVISYVPQGSWNVGSTGIVAVNVEGGGLATSPTTIPTTSIVNSCASNPATGQTVCTANDSSVYVLQFAASATSLAATLTSGGSGFIDFSGGVCTNCGVAMDATHNKAMIGLSIAGTPGFQFLDLAAATFEPPFATLSSSLFPAISEDPLLDPIRNLLLSAAENNNYEIVDVTTSTSPAFFENPIPGFIEADSSAEDCSTGIVLAPSEFSDPSLVFIADISNPAFAPFTAGSPGTWSAPSQVQTLTGSSLAAGSSGMAVAQGTHTGVVTGEFFGQSTLTAIALPATSGGGATPAISNWISCDIGLTPDGFPWNNGFDPHTVTAYQSPADGHAIALIANADFFTSSATWLARVDLTAMLALPASGNVCTSRTLPPTVISFISLL
jgi:hypothetical protein